MPQPDPSDDVKRQEIKLEVVPYTFGHGPGRPLFLTARRFIMICKMIETGMSATEACRRALVSYAGFRNHVTRNPKYQKRLKAAELCRDHVFRAEALDCVRSAFGKNWAAAMTYLERRWPNEYALRNVNRESPSDPDRLIATEIPESRLHFYGTIMKQVELENEQRALAEPAELPDAT